MLSRTQCFLDEVTSALDDNGEDMIYHQVSAVCDTFVSVGTCVVVNKVSLCLLLLVDAAVVVFCYIL